MSKGPEILYKKVIRRRKVYDSGAAHVQKQQEGDDVCSPRDRWDYNMNGVTLGSSSELLFV